MLRKNSLLSVFILVIYLLSYVNTKKCIVVSHNNGNSKSISEIENSNLNNEDSGDESSIPLNNDFNGDSEVDSDIESDSIITSVTITTPAITTITSKIITTNKATTTTVIETASSVTVLATTNSPKSTKTASTENTTTEIESVSSTTSPISISTSVPTNKDVKEHLSPYLVFVKVEPTKKNKETLKYLRENYPLFFENYINEPDFICEDECFLDNLALVDLSNKVKAVMDKNTNLMSDSQFKEFKENDFPSYYMDLPEDEKISISSMVGITSYDDSDKSWYSLYVYSNDLIMEVVKKELNDNILRYYEDGMDETDEINNTD